ncbi:7941_t:CDS:1, partial [Dentiscutata erythropus]
MPDIEIFVYYNVITSKLSWPLRNTYHHERVVTTKKFRTKGNVSNHQKDYEQIEEIKFS